LNKPKSKLPIPVADSRIVPLNSVAQPLAEFAPPVP
jgi:hypothetical protein